jgi:hypothetical protein
MRQFERARRLCGDEQPFVPHRRIERLARVLFKIEDGGWNLITE